MSSDYEREELEKTLDLVTAIIEESEAGAIDWMEDPETPPGKDGFHTFIAGKEVFVRSNDGDGRQPFTFMILQGGSAIQKLDTALEYEGLRDGWQGLIGQLYAQARTRGKPINKTLEEMMKEIEHRRAQRNIPF